MNVLAKILKDVRADVGRRAEAKPIVAAKLRGIPRRSLIEAIEAAPHVPIIAEVKRSSPSAGDIRPDADPVEAALAMLRGGAISLSVLTERKYFKGDPSFLREIRKVANVPLLYKDFVVDYYQICEAAQAGADSVLLIAKVLGKDLPRFMRLAAKFGMESLVEVTNEQEVTLAERAEAKLIGVNNRDLETLGIELNRTAQLAPLISEDATLVSESGINSPNDVREMLDAGADAVLVGTAIMRDKNIERKVRSLVKAR